MKKVFIFFSLLLMAVENYGQSPKTINLDDCYKLARQQYPLIKQHDLIEKAKDYSIQNASKGYYPQFSVNGQATYQSAVTTIPMGALPKPFNDISFPVPSKDQYKVTGEVDQMIYDGGAIKYTKQADDANAKIQQQNLEVELYALKDRVNQVFFGVLLMDEQLKQNVLTQKDIQSSIDKIQEGVNNGTATINNVYEFQATLMQQQQNKIQLQASRKAYLDMLGVFTNQQLDENTILQTPHSVAVSDSIKRPELMLYDAQKRSYNIQDYILSASNSPRFSFFFQGGYGRPGLNMFDNTFQPYYISGFRFSWMLGGYYTLKNQRQILEINRKTTDIQKETFLFNTNIALKQQNSDIQKLRALIEKDNEIISKRTEVKNASKVQMENGVVTVHEYISQLDAEDQARQNLLLHQVQLLLAEYSYLNTTGN